LFPRLISSKIISVVQSIRGRYRRDKAGIMQTFADWISLPENRSAQTAVERVADGATTLNPLFLHGPAGTGKSHLVAALIARVIQQTPDRTISSLTANAFETLVRASVDADA